MTDKTNTGENVDDFHDIGATVTDTPQDIPEALEDTPASNGQGLPPNADIIDMSKMSSFEDVALIFKYVMGHQLMAFSEGGCPRELAHLLADKEDV